MDFTIINVLIPVENGYDTVDVQVVDNAIAAISPGCDAIGKKADLVMYDLTSLSLLPRTDPIGLLVLGRPTNVVNSVWVNGKQIVADGKVKTIDVDNLRQELFNHSQWQTTRTSLTVGQIETHYRTVMGL